MSERILLDVTDGVADVRLNRPDKLNALDGALFQAIVDAGEALKIDRSVRVVVLSGEGRGFCAGLDFGSFQAMAQGPAAPPDDAGQQRGGGSGSLGAIGRTDGRITHLGQQACWVWQELEVPVIAAVHGAALGGGLQIALGADVRIVAPDAKLSVLESRWGLIPDMTGTQALVRLVGLDVAKDLTFTGRMVTGTEAVALGLATRVAADPRAAAFELAADLVTKSPDALRHGKRLLNLSGTRPAAEQFLDERETMASLIGSPNQVEATMAYFEKRPPRFS
ncbi:MAG TPA: crotonase/enoyl-CoA hydratase family protein [Acidimicrobiales bacterium]|jgi:enoyl-CoA hydratase/carnithine racemase|nr:crotonase/enoyl-CoA hydratase family protein [Acidimicrobiales bacterium]